MVQCKHAPGGGQAPAEWATWSKHSVCPMEDDVDESEAEATSSEEERMNFEERVGLPLSWTRS